MNEISVLIKGSPESPFIPSTTQGHSKKTAIYGPGSDSDQTSISQCMMLDSPASGKVRSHPGYDGFVTAAQTD